MSRTTTGIPKPALDTIRYKIALYLWRNGPNEGQNIASDLDLRLDLWWMAVNIGRLRPGEYHPWFTCLEPGVHGWTLTKAGRDAIRNALIGRVLFI